MTCILERLERNSEGEKAVEKDRGRQSILSLPSSRDTISLAGRGSDTKNWEPDGSMTLRMRAAPAPPARARVGMLPDAHASNKALPKAIRCISTSSSSTIPNCCAMDSRYFLALCLLFGLETDCHTFPRLSFRNNIAVPNHRYVDLGMVGTSFLQTAFSVVLI